MPPEEQIILQWLAQYEVITVEQAVGLLHHKSKTVAQKIIRGLRKQHLLSFVHGGTCIGAYPCSVPDPKTIDAIWVLIQYADKINHFEHHHASYPAQIFFLKEGIGYKIVVLNEGEEHLVRLLTTDEDVRYIFVVANESMIPKITPPDAPCIFAMLQRDTGRTPEVIFYS